MRTIINELKEKSLSGNTVKMLAIIAMIIDHIGWAFVGTNTILALIMHSAGKMTGPIMCYFIAEGNHYSKSKVKYIERLGIFAVISHVPYNIFVNNGTVTLLPTSVIFTLLCGLLALIVFENVENKIVKYTLIVLITAVTYEADWAIFGVLFILGFGIFYGDQKKQMLSFVLLSVAKVIYGVVTDGGFFWYTTLPRILSVVLVIMVLSFYNGSKGGNKYSKWAFYIIYPLQFLIIGGIALLLGTV